MSSPNLVIVDYGLGNLGSIQNMLKYLGHASTVSRDPEAIVSADKLILPGVGAFDNGMENIASSGIRPALDRRVQEDRRPILGICLGMQLMTQGSQEGIQPGLGYIDAETVMFEPGAGKGHLKVPHIGWNTIKRSKKHPLTDGLDKETRFYFVHSYHVRCREPGDVLLTTHYGLDFCSAFQRGNIMGVQFHPEKSHRFGMRLLKNFVELA